MTQPSGTTGLNYGTRRRREIKGGEGYPFWDGTSEFVVDSVLARALCIHKTRRTYKCFRRKSLTDLYVLTTLHASSQLCRALRVECRGDSHDARHGVVKAMAIQSHPYIKGIMGTNFSKSNAEMQMTSLMSMFDGRDEGLPSYLDQLAKGKVTLLPV